MERLALAVEACPLVAGLHGGAFGEVATYLPGRQVRGVRVTDAGLEIHVVGRYPATMSEIAAQVRAAAAGMAGSTPVHVRIEDLAEIGEPVPSEPIIGSRLVSAGPAPHAGAPTFPPPSAHRPVSSATTRPVATTPPASALHSTKPPP